MADRFLVGAEVKDPALIRVFDRIQQAFVAHKSPPAQIVAAVSDLPPPARNQGRTLIVRDIDGLGNPGKATALDGSWFDESWSAL